MLKVQRLWVLGLVALMVAVVVVGCAKKAQEDTGVTPSGAQAPTGEPYTIGAVFAVTGPAASLGTPEKETAEMLEKKINDEGGIDGHPLRVIIYDTAGDEDSCLRAVNRLIQNDKALAIVGPSRSGTTLAIIPTVEQAQIPLVSCAAAVKITEPIKKWVFKTPQTDAMAVARIFGVLTNRGIKTIGAIISADAFGEEGLVQMKKALPAGVSIVSEEKFQATDTDMTTQLTRMKGKKPQAVICWGIGPGPAIIAKNMKQLGFNVPLFMSHGVANKSFIEGAGPAAEGVMFPAGKLLVADSLPDTDRQKKILLDYKAEFEKTYNKAPDTFGGHAWDALMMVTEALRESGPDSAKLRDELENTRDFVGIGGVFNMSPTDHNGLSPDAFVMVTIQNGQWVLAKEQ